MNLLRTVHISSAAAGPPGGAARRSVEGRATRREAAAAWAVQCWPAERGGGRPSMRRRDASAASPRDRLTHAASDRLREHAADGGRRVAVLTMGVLSDYP